MKAALTTSRQPRISLALLDFEMRNRLEHVLSRANYEVVTASRADDLCKLLSDPGELRCFDLVIWDAELLDGCAVRTIEDRQSVADFPRLILVTAFSNYPALRRVSRLRAEADFDMPLETYHQLATVLRILSR